MKPHIKDNEVRTIKLYLRHHLDWWRYLLERPLSLRAFICRWRGHPNGVVWYNLGSDEPNMHCKNCGDDLG